MDASDCSRRPTHAPPSPGQQRLPELAAAAAAIAEHLATLALAPSALSISASAFTVAVAVR